MLDTMDAPVYNGRMVHRSVTNWLDCDHGACMAMAAAQVIGKAYSIGPVLNVPTVHSLMFLDDWVTRL